MSDTDHVLGLLDDLMKLIAGSPAATIEVEADGFAVTVTRSGGTITTPARAPVAVAAPHAQDGQSNSADSAIPLPSL